ncbi:hypothetical protein BDR05DRAFT_1013973, partial [Suillus weaverae]
FIRRGISEERRQVMMGSSHGRFIAAHLKGQHPTLFNAASHHNPVISVGELAHQGLIFLIGCILNLGFQPPTDSYTSPMPNSLTPLPSNSNSPTSDAPTPTPPLMTPQTYNTLLTASTIVHVDNITAPVLISIGEDDLRVLPGQGIGFYHPIKGRRGGTATGDGTRSENGDTNVVIGSGETRTGIVEMLSFPGGLHAIEAVEAARVSWEATRDWFKAFAVGS